MHDSIERLCTACQTCITVSVRRKQLKAKFDPNAPPSTMIPRQDYGIDFYGIFKGEILVMVDLFTRETILAHLNTRTQTCITASVRRKHLKAKFDPNAPPSTMIPQQDYGIDFYGIFKGEILVLVDLFTRETIFYLGISYSNEASQHPLGRIMHPSYHP